jgi:hypothetical protein
MDKQIALRRKIFSFLETTFVKLGIQEEQCTIFFIQKENKTGNFNSFENRYKMDRIQKKHKVKAGAEQIETVSQYHWRTSP